MNRSPRSYIEILSRFPDLQIIIPLLLLMLMHNGSRKGTPCLQWPDRSGFSPDSLLTLDMR